MNNSYRMPPVLTRAAAYLAATALLASCAQMPQSSSTPRPAEPVPEALVQATPEPRLETQSPEPETTSPAPATPAPKQNPLYAWNGTGRAVSHIEIDVDKQRARFFDGQQEVGWTTVASGIRSFPTPTGRYTVMAKEPDAKSNLYGKIYGKGGNLVKGNAQMGIDPVPPGGRFEGADMPYFLRFTGDGIGMHAGPIPRPGSPASHGCIRMPKALAPILFNHVKVGTQVSIVGGGPSYAAYAAQAQRKAAAIALAKAKRAEAKAAETQLAMATEAAAGAKVPTDGSSPSPDKPQNTPSAVPAPAGASQTTAAATPPKPDVTPPNPVAAAPKTTGASPQSAPMATQNPPSPAKMDGAVTSGTGSAPAKPAASSSAAATPVAPQAKPDASAAPVAAKTADQTQKPLAAQLQQPQPVKADAAPANTTSNAPAARPPAKPEPPAPVTVKSAEPTPKAAAPNSPSTPGGAVAGSAAGPIPAAPKPAVDSSRATTHEKEG